MYELLGRKGLLTNEFPPVETALIGGDIGFRQHSGGHTPGPNWPTFVAFASRYLPSSALPGTPGGLTITIGSGLEGAIAH